MAETLEPDGRDDRSAGWSPYPALWPYLAAKASIDAWQRWLDGGSADRRKADPSLDWTTSNRLALEIADLRLRDFSCGETGTPALICAPYALHGALIADFAAQHSIVAALRHAGLSRVFLAEWRSASPDMGGWAIDNYLSDLNVAVDEIGLPVDLIGLCQGGWLSLIYAARFPGKVRRLVLAGVPVDTSVPSALSRMVATTPPELFMSLIDSGSGLVRGEHVRRVWTPSPDVEVALQRRLSLEASDERALRERFARWNMETLDLPGVFYLQTVDWIFRENRLATGAFVALGRTVRLNEVTLPVFLLAGAEDDVVPSEQALATAALLGTPRGKIATEVAPSSHLGLFMGRETIGRYWPHVADWLRAGPADH